MSLEIEAVYEKGVLKLQRPLAMEDGQRVRVTIQPIGGRARQSYGLLVGRAI
jgi:predicted DNA-binding antitoxin AbrB/MazE fold protein